MARNINSIKGTPKAIGNRVLVTDMNFGEQKTAGGIIITSDDGKSRGVYPRWGKVFSKGPRNNDPYEVGEWILVEHGRWTRGIKVEDDSGESFEIRMVEAESILAYSNEKPDSVSIGSEYSDGPVSISPESFGAGS
jgi:co-chaperonin GroES (HSP10)